ncbi:MAG: DMT family transporter [Alphaproteobacteria bacterium]|nr:DMT family transporter [Alphaproteobacteria bacterium]
MTLPPPNAGDDRARVLRAMILMSAAVSLYPLGDAIAKHLTQTYPVVFVTWARYLFNFLIMAAVLGGPRVVRHYRTAQPRLQVARGVLAALSTMSFIAALHSITLVDAYALLFANPLIIVALSVPLLGERVGLHRWSAVLFGFAGVLIVLRPGGEFFQWGSLFALFSAFSVALINIMTRRLSATDAPMTILLYMATVGTLVLSLAVPFHWAEPTWDAWVLLFLAGLVGGLGHLGAIMAIRMAPLSAVAPFSYVQIVTAVILGYVVFRELPDQWAVTGMAVIIGAGLYLLRRERAGR